MEQRRTTVTDEATSTTSDCCGRPTADECRCYTDAAELAGAVRAFVARRAKSPEDADDITQETLLRLYRSAGRPRS